MTKDIDPAKFFILGFDGLEPPEPFLRFAEENGPAGFLLLGHNFRDRQQLRGLVKALKDACGERIILAVDQEPGRVQRFRGDFPLSKKPNYYLKQNNIVEFRSWCGATAEAMISVGLNMNMAPVLDMLPTNAEYPVLKDRAFGDEPDRVAEFGAVLIDEFKQRKIATCAKHFPGLGCATFDPHEAMSQSDDSLERFLDYHWRPFKSAARSGVDCMMTTHLLARAIDTENCATFSRNAISHLKNTVGHRGIIISDDLNMAGANSRNSIGEAAVDSIIAGHNLLILSKTIEMQIESIEAVRRKCDTDPVFRELALENQKKTSDFCNVI